MAKRTCSRFPQACRLRIALDFLKRLMAVTLQVYEMGHSTAPPALLTSEERNTLEAVL